MVRLGLIIIFPIRSRTLRDAWRLIEKYNIHEADALQIATARELKAGEFVTRDGLLYEIAAEEGLKSMILA